MSEEFKRLKRELVYKGAIVDFYKDTILVPNGNIVEWDFIGHQGAAAVVPVRKDGKLLMVRQYRNALDRYTLEIPAGGLNGADEPTRTAAARELEEETGYVAGKLEASPVNFQGSNPFHTHLVQKKRIRNQPFPPGEDGYQPAQEAGQEKNGHPAADACRQLFLPHCPFSISQCPPPLSFPQPQSSFFPSICGAGRQLFLPSG